MEREWQKEWRKVGNKNKEWKEVDEEEGIKKCKNKRLNIEVES